MGTKLTLGFSPCPNDCFIFDALIHGKIDTEGLEFDVLMADVEELNRKAFAGGIDITKLSYFAYAHLTNEYQLLNAGSALGKGVGPLLISKEEVEVEKVKELNKIVIPGKFTTANLLFTHCFPGFERKEEMLFSEIEDAVLNGKADAGVIIHENRFTYLQRGLKKIIDLGEYWERTTGCAIPLGGIVIRRDLPEEVKSKVDRLVRKSVEFAFAHPDSCMDFVRANAQEMEEEVMKKHIALYVNDYSVDLGEEGQKAVLTLFSKAGSAGLVKEYRKDIFLEPSNRKNT